MNNWIDSSWFWHLVQMLWAFFDYYIDNSYKHINNIKSGHNRKGHYILRVFWRIRYWVPQRWELFSFFQLFGFTIFLPHRRFDTPPKYFFFFFFNLFFQMCFLKSLSILNYHFDDILDFCWADWKIVNKIFD